MRRSGKWLATIAPIVAASVCILAFRAAEAQDGPSFAEPTPPLGLVEVFYPDDNPYTPQKAELGCLLYFDKRLSADNSIACASCHSPEHAFTDGEPFSLGIRDQKGGRSAPTVINRAYSVEQFWDGRAPTLEDQAKGPIQNPIEMGETHANVVDKLRRIPGYVERFQQVFGTSAITIDQAARAIATFERTVLSGNSPYDRFKAGDTDALTEAQQRGKLIFEEKAKCNACHFGFNLTDGSFANVGVAMDQPALDEGRFAVTKNPDDFGAFKTPTLREIEHTGPYMHDGSLKTLEEVVEHYNKGRRDYPDARVKINERIKPLNLNDRERADLVAFLKAFSGEGWQHIRPPARFP